MNGNHDFEPLDSLLAKPALITDGGFSERLSIEFNKTATLRNRIFIVAGACWLILAFFVITPQSLSEGLAVLGTALSLSEPFSILATELNSIDYSLLQTNSISIAGFGIALSAILSLVLRDQF